jgi:uncharacterized protein with von Willebrand factor type A (vWA) domain
VPGLSTGKVYARIPERGPGGFDGQLLGFAEELRQEGMALGTSELLDTFEALQHISWTQQADFKEAMAATLAKSPEDRRVFELVFERFFFRAAEAEASRQNISESAAGQGAAGDLELDRPARRSRPPGHRRVRQGRGLRGPRRRRAAHPPGARPAHRTPA